MRKTNIYWSIFIFILFCLIFIKSGNIITVLNLQRKNVICETSLIQTKIRHTYWNITDKNKNSHNIIPSTVVRGVNLSKGPIESQGYLDNTTIVTAYYNLGRFKKTVSLLSSLYYDTNLYHQWASVFRYISNPLVVYTDSDDFAELMSNIRKDLPSKTVILKINRWDVWAFQFYDEICRIFKQPDYPVITLNTERPDYSCAMHSKFVLMGDAVRRNLFHTEFYQWLDIGLFRDIVSEKKYFRMKLPVNFDHTKIAYTKVRDNPMATSPDKIIKGNLLWVSGATFLGKWDVLLKFERLYKKAVKYFISQNLINTDQQMLYAIYSDTGRRILEPDVEIQLYSPEKDSKIDPWFYLGYICRDIIT